MNNVKMFFVLLGLMPVMADALECKVSCHGTTAEYERITDELKIDSSYRMSPSEAMEVGTFPFEMAITGSRSFKTTVQGATKVEIRANAAAECEKQGIAQGFKTIASTHNMFCEELHPESPHEGSWDSSYWPNPMNDWNDN